jgi:hypothetical protein
MSTEISRYFTEQLKDSLDAIYFDLGISSKLSDRLEEVIRRNTIVDIAAKVEVYQKKLNDIERKLFALEGIVKRQEKSIIDNQEANKNAEVNDDIKIRQQLIVRKMKKTEGDFIRVKFDCNAFLYEVFNT